MISMVVAMDLQGVIGKDNRLPWHIPGDLAHFRRITDGHTVVMGRKTYESIGFPLPNRRNVIITRNAAFRPEGCITVSSLQTAMAVCENEEIFVIGGAEIYREFLPYADRLHITRLEGIFEGDVRFPEIKWDEWELVSRVQGPVDAGNPCRYRFEIYDRHKAGFIGKLP